MKRKGYMLKPFIVVNLTSRTSLLEFVAAFYVILFCVLWSFISHIKVKHAMSCSMPGAQ